MLQPTLPTTQIGSEPWEWLPATFPDLLTELNAIVQPAKHAGDLFIYRGQPKRSWLLDSTFARDLKRRVFNVPLDRRFKETIHPATEYHRRFATERFLFKFGESMKPHERIMALGPRYDQWYEVMRELQQNPREDLPHPDFGWSAIYLQGTFLIDWSVDADVALYFANRRRRGAGALWVANATASGRIQMRKTVGSMLKLMKRTIRRLDASLGIPLIFHPSVQRDHLRAQAQKAIYVAQMELGFDLSEVWANLHSTHGHQQVVFKLVLPDGSQDDCARYLRRSGLTTARLFPHARSRELS